jgi:hypothetical protein
MDQNPDTEPFSLYKYEYSSGGKIHTEWVWVSEEEESKDYFYNLEDEKILSYRLATEDELEAYNYAFEDGLMIGGVRGEKKFSNGVTYELVSWGEKNDEPMLADTLKVFICGKCNERRVFENDAMRAGDNVYLSVEKDSVLWHLCWQCFSGEESKNV